VIGYRDNLRTVHRGGHFSVVSNDCHTYKHIPISLTVILNYCCYKFNLSK
jgi:hypothetical protein